MVDPETELLLEKLKERIEQSEIGFQHIPCPLQKGELCQKYKNIQSFSRTNKLTVFLMYPYSSVTPDYFEETVKLLLSKYTRIENILISKTEPQHGIKICHVCELAQKAKIGLALINPINSNVFLEIGMLWGMGKDCILLFWKDNENKDVEVPFDISSHMIVRFRNKEELENELEKVVQKIIIERDFLMNLIHFPKEQIDRKISQTNFKKIKKSFNFVLRALNQEREKIAVDAYFYYLQSSIASRSDEEKKKLIKLFVNEAKSIQNFDLKKRFFSIIHGLVKMDDVSAEEITSLFEYLLDEYENTSSFKMEYEITTILDNFSNMINAVQVNRLTNILNKKMSGFHGWNAAKNVKKILKNNKNHLSKENLKLIEE